MLIRAERLARGRTKLTCRAIRTAVNVSRFWGLPIEDAAEALRQAAEALQPAASAKRISWPTEDERSVSNGTPDHAVLALARSIIWSNGDQMPADTVVRKMQRHGVKRRRTDMLRLVRSVRNREDPPR